MDRPRLEIASATALVERGPVRVEIGLHPFRLDVRRAGRRLVRGLGLWAAAGAAADVFLPFTEGVIPQEEVEDREELGRVADLEPLPDGLAGRGTLAGGRAARVAVRVTRGRVVVELEADDAPLRLGATWEPRGGEHLTGLGARHVLALDQAGRRVQLGADRRYTGPDCPPDMLDMGGIPQGDYAPLPWLVSSRGYGVWLETDGNGALFDLDAGPTASCRAAAGPLRLHLLCDPTPAGLLRRLLRGTGLPALLPEWGYGHWKSRDVYEDEGAFLDDLEGYARHRLPLDALVLDSPWATQYNSWDFNRAQFPDPQRMLDRVKAAGVRTVAWVTPWVNVESADGQRPADPESDRLARLPAANYEEGARLGHFVLGADGDPLVAAWWMGTGSLVDFTSPAAEAWWREQALGILLMGVEGIKADDGEGYYLPDDARVADGRTGAEAAWALGGLYRRSMQRALDEAHPDGGVVFGRGGWTGQQATGILWGGDQASDFWSLRALVTATLTAALSGFSNWSHDIGGYLGEKLIERCPKELLVRWVQFGCFSPLMHAHARFEQEPWAYDEETLDLYREYLVLHERLVPYVRAAAATAARCGLPVVRPLPLCDPGDERGWTLADAYGFGPALWVAPVLERGAREREVVLPRGTWIDFWTGERTAGGGEVLAPAPLGRIPVWVRSGSLVVTHPADAVAGGLRGPEAERPLEATLWGEPRLGRAAARLADGTRVRWERGSWSVEPDREVVFRQV